MLGVLGGMGPAATTDFLQLVTEATDAARDQDHIRTLVYSDPITPDRSDAILGHGISPLPWMRRGVEFLNDAGCPVIAIPCSTAHHWHAELQADSAAPILHIAQTTAGELAATRPAKVVALLATAGTVRSRIYDDRLAAAGVSIVDTGGDDPHGVVMTAVRQAKAGSPDAARRIITDATAGYAALGVEAIIVACTDLAAALRGLGDLHGTPLVDASASLARAAVARMADLAAAQ